MLRFCRRSECGIDHKNQFPKNVIIHLTTRSPKEPSQMQRYAWKCMGTTWRGIPVAWGGLQNTISGLNFLRAWLLACARTHTHTPIMLGKIKINCKTRKIWWKTNMYLHYSYWLQNSFCSQNLSSANSVPSSDTSILPSEKLPMSKQRNCTWKVAFLSPQFRHGRG